MNFSFIGKTPGIVISLLKYAMKGFLNETICLILITGVSISKGKTHFATN